MITATTILNTCKRWWACGQKVNLKRIFSLANAVTCIVQALPGPFLQWNLFLSSILKAATMNTKACVQLCLSTEDCQRTRAHHLFKHRRLNYWRKKKRPAVSPSAQSYCWNVLHLSGVIRSRWNQVIFSDWFRVNWAKTGQKFLRIWPDTFQRMKSWSLQMQSTSLNLPERRSKVGKFGGKSSNEIYPDLKINKFALYCVPSDNLRGGGGLGVYHSHAATPANSNRAGILFWKRCVDPLVKDL